MQMLCPQGIGDVVWCLLKAQDISRKIGDGKVEIRLACGDLGVVSTRSFWFCKRFPFVHDVEMAMCEIVPTVNGCPSNEQGYYRYIPDGYAMYDDYYALMPNAALERGKRIEQWLPEFEIDWSVPQQFQFEPEETEYAARFLREIGPYAVFYFGPMDGNTRAGHNRGALWTPADWAEIGRAIEKHDLRIVCVGAGYDREYWDKAMKFKAGSGWFDCIGAWEIGTTLAILKNAALTVAYQSGIGVMSTYFGTPTAMWWRAKGDSVNERHHVSFEEKMKDAWVPPETLKSGRYLGLIYERETPKQIVEVMESRGWFK